MAIWAWSSMFPGDDLRQPHDQAAQRARVGRIGLLAHRTPEGRRRRWYNRPLTLGVIVLLMTVALISFSAEESAPYGEIEECDSIFAYPLA